jgi:hypothetical protein
MGGRLYQQDLALISNETGVYIPAITARLTSTVAQRVIRAKFQVKSGDVTLSWKQITIWVIVAKQILLFQIS